MDTNETTVITKAGPEDMIATAWFSLGYKPRNSLVVIGLEGPRQRVGVLLRADLPRSDLLRSDLPRSAHHSGPSSSHSSSRSAGNAERCSEELRPMDQLSPKELRAVLPGMVADLLATVATSGARGVLAIVADENALDRRPPAVVRLLRHGVREFGLRLFDVLGLTSTAFSSLLCRDPRCCPPGGRPIAQVLSSRTAAAHVVYGDTVAESEADLLADVTHGPSDPPCDPPSVSLLDADPDPDPDAAVYPDSDPRSERSPLDWLSLEQRWTWWERWNRACVSAAKIPSQAEPLRGFSAALHDWYLRDAVLMSLLGAAKVEVRDLLDGSYAGMAGYPGGPGESRDGTDRDGPGWDGRGGGPGWDGQGWDGTDRDGPDWDGRGWDGLGQLGAPEPAAEQFRQDLVRLLRQRPDGERLNAGRTVLAAAVRVAGKGDRGPALAVLAMLAWFEGRGGRARLLVEQAQADAPWVSLTRLVEDLLMGRIPPPWLSNGSG